MQPKNLSSTKLQASFQDFAQNSSIVFYRCSLNKHFPIIEISENTKKLLGLEAAAFYENTALWMDRIHPENRPYIKKLYRETIDHKRQTLAYRFKHSEGHYLWLRDERMVEYGEDGNSAAIIGTVIDITRQKKAEHELYEINQTLDKRIRGRTRNVTDTNRKLKKQLQQSDELENKFMEQQKKLRLLQTGINCINDMVVISKAPADDPLNSSIVLVNKAFEDFTGYSGNEILGKCPSILHGKKTDSAKVQKLNAGIKKNEHTRVEFVNYKKDGSSYWVDLEMSPFPAEEDDMLYWAGINRDISEQIQYREALEKSLHEKDTLLAEVHHRVKNNLAVISGLLEMQSFNADNTHVAGALQESQSRIQSIAMVHEILYQSDSFAGIELNLYIDELVPYIAKTFKRYGTNIRFEKDLDPISLTVKQAVPCGLLLNELITNAYKHAFRGIDEGTIYISLHQRENSIELEVRDNGIGLPAGLDAERPSSLGMKLIKTLVTQLDGSLAVKREPHTAFNIIFSADD